MIDFPDFPILNDTFTAENGRVWVWDGARWESVGVLPTGGGGSGSITVSEAAPENASEGDLWFNSVDTNTYIYYDSFWIQASDSKAGPAGPAGPSGTNGIPGPAGSEGPPGPGIASGGTEGQFLTKSSSVDYQTAWSTIDTTKAYAQFNKIAGATYGSGHQNIVLDESAIASNISLNTSNGLITFSATGVYMVTVGWRFGTAGDVWTGANLATASGTIVGRSFGTGNVVNDPGPVLFSFMANVTDISTGYYLRLYRAGGSMALATPDTQAGRAIVSTIVKIS